MNHIDTIGDFCNREVVVIGQRESLATAAGLMHAHRVGCIVVSEQRGAQRMPVGILTDRDITLKLLRDGGGLEAHRVEEAMTRSPLMLAETDTLTGALEHMRAHAVRRAPVIGSDGALVGIVAVDDMVDILATMLSQLSRLIQRQLHPEPSIRSFTLR